MAAPDFSLALSRLRDVVNTLSRFLDGREIPDDVLDAQILKVELCYREIVCYESMRHTSVEQSRALDCLREVIRSLMIHLVIRQ